jgi:hypothetical protein
LIPRLFLAGSSGNSIPVGCVLTVHFMHINTDKVVG